jgi:multisubunit Na+/H+ antiporter MnhF subunit
MTLNMLEQLSAILVGLALLLGFVRLLIGPTAQDRVVSADTLSVIVTAGLVGVAAWLGNAIYLDVALVYGALAFVGIVAIARAIEGGHQ